MRLFILLLFLGVGLPSPAFSQPPADSKCNYEEIPIETKITSIKQFATSGSPKHEVRFLVLLTPQLPTKVENRVYGRDFQMLLRNKTFPGPLFLEKYEISPGKVFDCIFHLIIRGTCKPYYFEFPEINLDDYFESQPQS
jgi:hypothetical protein